MARDIVASAPSENNSFFAESNLLIDEILKFTYWWSQDLNQNQIWTQLGLGASTSVDWDMFCRELCEVVIMNEGQPLGGYGKTVQIDESNIGKRKHHKGHCVEGQWVFGGIEQDSRKSFMFPVEKRDEDTLLPIIQHWIKPGTLIVSDCWKAFLNLRIRVTFMKP